MTSFKIGNPGWKKDLLELTAPLGPDFWLDFHPVSVDEVRRLEITIERTLPSDFFEFYTVMGCGWFSKGGGILSPQDVLACLAAPIFFVNGSAMQGKEWCTGDEHIQLWVSRGRINPVPQRFTSAKLRLDGVNLYDLLQVGSDGCCSYHQLHLPEKHDPHLGYCILSESRTLECRAPTFSVGLMSMIDFYTAT